MAYASHKLDSTHVLQYRNDLDSEKPCESRLPLSLSISVFREIVCAFVNTILNRITKTSRIALIPNFRRYEDLFAVMLCERFDFVSADWRIASTTHYVYRLHILFGRFVGPVCAICSALCTAEPNRTVCRREIHICIAISLHAPKPQICN